MFERYTEQARRALFFARYESSQLGSVSIEPEHLLLGVLREPAAITDLIAIPTVDAVRRQVFEEAAKRTPTSTSVEIPFATETKRALEAAARAADGLLHGHIGTEHLLLALAEIAGTARLLTANGVSVETLRQRIADRPVPLGSPLPPITSANPADLREARRHATLRQLDSAVTFLRSIDSEHASIPEAGRLIAQICRDLEALKTAIAGA
jgi:ATP-dependent Clp protease ATP-binding subunit ClpC